MLANVLQKADSHILERRLVEKREQGEGMPYHALSHRFTRMEWSLWYA